MMPQTVPFYRPTGVPSPPNPVDGQPPVLRPTMPCPPVAWSPISSHYPQPTFINPQQPTFINPQQPTFDNPHADDERNGFVGAVPLQPSLPLPAYFGGAAAAADAVPTDGDRPGVSHQHGRWFAHRQQNDFNKYDTKHEKFRKYLEQNGILSSFTNILTELYQDPVKPIDPLGFLVEKLNGSQPETFELLNLQLWCEQYRMKIEKLQTELNHVIERLRKYEPYDTDDTISNRSSLENTLESCVLEEVSSQGQTLKQSEENGSVNHNEFISNNQCGDNHHQ